MLYSTYLNIYPYPTLSPIYPYPNPTGYTLFTFTYII